MEREYGWSSSEEEEEEEVVVVVVLVDLINSLKGRLPRKGEIALQPAANNENRSLLPGEENVKDALAEVTVLMSLRIFGVKDECESIEGPQQKALMSITTKEQEGNSTYEITEEEQSVGDDHIASTRVREIKMFSTPPVLILPGVVSSVIEPSLNQLEVDNARSRSSSTTKWDDILKSVVYGGLIEVITSMGVVSSAAGCDLWELKSKQNGLRINITDVEEETVDGSYEQVLGQRNNFLRHAIVVVLSYLVFGLLPPITYGFSFRESDNKEYKLIAVVAVSVICIVLLATGKAYTQKPPKPYIMNIMYFVNNGLIASRLSYVLGELIKKLLVKLGLFEISATATPFPPPSAFLLQTISSAKPPAAWRASY
ncbi:protein of unknown function DUF125 [Macleaya cordata]|uniref:Uncharacterized protein n=1 Tax=Macleaya cordata TaxID=56857 RepID=A0A200QYX4_MACCD|nr:protein of unknown function DUF125 [Macleaya cordata]